MAPRSIPTSAALLLAAIQTCMPLGAQEAVSARWELSPEAPYVGQTFELRLSIGLDGAWSDRALVQLYSRELDLPLQVDALPAPLPGLAVGPIDGAGPTLVVDGEVTRAQRDTRADGQRVVAIARRGVLESTAPVLLPAPFVRFVAASSFRDDPVRGEVAVAPVEGSVLGEPLQITARPLPEEERPLDFAGAVGSFTLTSSVTPRAFETGAVIELTIEVGGDGRLPDGAAPELEGVAPDFEALGPARRADRAFTFSLRSLRAGVERAPRARLSSFDPTGEGGSWEQVSVEGPPVAVRAAGPGVTTVDPLDATAANEARPSLTWTILTIGAVATLALVSALRRITYRAAVRAEGRIEEDA